MDNNIPTGEELETPETPENVTPPVKEDAKGKEEETPTPENPFDGDIEEEKPAGDGKSDIDADDEKTINAIVDKKLSKANQSNLETRVDVGLVKLFQEEDGAVYKPYEAKIKEYAKDPRTKGLSFRAIANMAVPASAWKKYGAELERKAAKESKASGSAGSSTRPTPMGDFPDTSKMSAKEFNEFTEKIKGGGLR